MIHLNNSFEMMIHLIHSTPAQNIDSENLLQQSFATLSKLLTFEKINGTIPDNYELAKNCLGHLKNRLDKTSENLSKNDEIIKYHLRKGIVEKVSESDEEKETGTVHYLPHQTVTTKEKKTTKLRIVCDSASR